MPDESSNKSMSEERSEDSGERSAQANMNPEEVLEKGRRAAEGKGPNSSGSVASSSVEEHVPGTSDPNPTDIPTANRPT